VAAPSPSQSPEPGLTAEVVHLVTDADTAAALGSGDVPVLATPRLLALAEAATVAAVAPAVPPERTSVGTRVELEHLLASPVGSRVAVQATLVAVDGRLLRFDVVALDPADARVLATGRVTRVVVDRDRFLARAAR
jgi:fluoroacetyl-CoA thioesterase